MELRYALSPSRPLFRPLTQVVWIVLLLDEADVFLEQRSLSDLERNSLVSGNPPSTPHHTPLH
jgi:hypothetical protein